MARRITAVADSETDPFEHGRVPEPFIWGLFDGRNYYEFSSTDEFVTHIKDRPYDLYAHNGGKYDWHFLLSHIEPGTECRVISGRIVELRMGQSRLLDSYSLLPTSLAAFEKMEFDYWKLERQHRDEYMGEIREYLRSDCENLYRYLGEYFKAYPKALTLAGAAFKVWQQMTGTRPPRTGPGFFEEFHPYYYGGRVECFERGVITGPLKIIDINSAYPTAMKQRHPWGNEYTSTPYKMPPDSEVERSFLVIDGVSHGAFPVRQDDGGIRFPHGEGRFYVTGHEYVAAIETGTFELKNPVMSTVFEDSIDFSEYVDHFYDLKLQAEREGDKNTRLFAKLFMNSLYGKFAANPGRYKRWVIDDWKSMTRERDRAGWDFECDIGHGLRVYSVPLEEEQRRYYNVATAASITGWVRSFMWRSLNEVERPVYCDTDSIICADTGSLRLGDGLGEWDLEGVADRVSIAGKKVYCARLVDGTTKTACKGARISATAIERVARGETVTYRSEAPTFSLTRGTNFVTREIVATAKCERELGVDGG